MAKKKPAAKLPVKKAPAKAGAKKPVAKAPQKKAAPMAKKAPAKKAPVKAAPKKAAPKKVETKKPAAKSSLKDTVLKAASKLMAKAKPLSKEQEKKAKEKEKQLAAKEKERLAKEAQKAKALAAKDKEKEAKDKAKQKELEKKQKEQEKLQAKADKEAEKLRAKNAKKKPKAGKGGDDEDDDEDIDLGPDDEPAFGDEERTAKAKPVDDDEDEFIEYDKKSKAAKKQSGKKAYEDDGHVDVFTPKQSKKYNNAIIAELESGIADEIAQLREHFNWKDIAEAIGTMDFFIDPKNDECIEKGCDNIRTTQSYCRLHYLRNWKTVQKKRDILKEGKLQEYIEELISKYPAKYIESLLSDLSDDKEFYRVLNELNITSEFDFEEDEFENAVDDDDADDDIGIETISSSLRYEDE